MKNILRTMAAEIISDDNLNNIPNKDVDPNVLVQNILNWAYFGIGIVAVVLIVYAGVQYVTSEGDPGKTQTAQRTITYAIIGLIVVLMAAVITNFIIGSMA